MRQPRAKTQLGGTIGSIQAPFSPDSDYCITFPADKAFERSDLERLAVFGPLAERNRVVIYFLGTLKIDDLTYLKQLLPNVALSAENERIQAIPSK
jgi:hypothetical protein